MKITIYWKTKDREIINAIRRRLNITAGMTVNGENEIDVTDDNRDKLIEFKNNKYIELRRK
jgi:hypothetical protein